MAGLGGLAGAIGLSVLTFAFHWLFFRAALGDGQYVMVFMFTIPAGAFLGAATGCALALSRTKPSSAGLACLIGFGLVAIPLGLYLWMTIANSQNTGDSAALTFISTLLFSFPTVAWMLWLLVWGLRLLGKR